MGKDWVHCHAGCSVPHDALLAGIDQDGSRIYVGKTRFNGDKLPVKVIPEKNVGYVAYGGKEYAVHDYKVLCGAGFRWEQFNAHRVPGNAIKGGETCNGERLYIGRVNHAGSVTVGKVHPSHHCIYIPFNGQEHRFEHGEILTEN